MTYNLGDSLGAPGWPFNFLSFFPFVVVVVIVVVVVVVACPG